MLVRLAFLSNFLKFLLIVNGQDIEPLPDLPKAYTASLMWNMKMTGVEDNNKATAITYSIVETVDEERVKSFIDVLAETSHDENGTMVYVIESEQVIWKPGGTGVDRYIDVVTAQSGSEVVQYCMADSHRKDSFIDFLFGFDMNTDEGFPSVSHMLHWGDKNYTYNGKDNINGVACNKYTGIWEVPAWSATFDVGYYWSDPNVWESTAGVGTTDPVALVIAGEATIENEKFNIVLNIDFEDFFEISMPDEFYQPPQDIYCDGRRTDMILPKLPANFMVDSELEFEFPLGGGEYKSLISHRREWFDSQMLVSRADYKPPNFEGNNTDPWLNENGMISQIHDYSTGLMYSIDQTYGNCTIEYLDESADGMDEHGHGHIHMMNPFNMFFNNDSFYYQGKYHQRGFEVDSFVRSAPLSKNFSGVMDNFTTVVMLTSLGWEVDNEGQDRILVPTRIIRYPTPLYNSKGGKMSVNYYNLRDYSLYMTDFDVSPCLDDSNKMHLMIRLGWVADMDIENTMRDFMIAVRTAVTMYGGVTPIRVQNIEVYVDEDNKSMFVVFTVLGFPPGFDILLNEVPSAFRSLDEVKSNIQNVVDSEEFGVVVFSKTGSIITAKAAKGSLVELGQRQGNVDVKDGYSDGSMAACGIILLLICTGGMTALLIFVIKP